MRKIYDTPEMEVVTLTLRDVLTASETLPPVESKAGGGELDNDDDWDTPTP